MVQSSYQKVPKHSARLVTYKSAQWARCIYLTFYSKCQSNKHVDGDSQKLTDSV